MGRDTDARATPAQHEAVRRVREAVEAVTRYSARGCSGMACDLALRAWLGNQLGIIGAAASAVPDESRVLYPGIPWQTLADLADEGRGVASMTVEQMQRFVERELPAVRNEFRSRRQRR
jgi:uncharacterized protein with HEPN domain